MFFFFEKRKESLSQFICCFRGAGGHFSPNCKQKVILIERYKNEDANIITAKNISPDGIRFKLLKDSFDIFTVEKVSVFGAFTKKLVDL